MSDLYVIEASGLHTALPADVHDIAKTWIGADVFAHTETTDSAYRAIVKAGWDPRFLYRSEMPDGRPGEILIGWNPDTMGGSSSSSPRLTDTAWKVGRIERDGVTAGRVRLTHRATETTGVIYGVHWPSGVFNFAIRQKAHREASAALGALIAGGVTAHPDRWRLALGDTNLDHRRPLIRKQMEHDLHLDDVWSSQSVSTGSHGSRLIDAIFSYGLHTTAAGVRPETAASDHRNVWGKFRIGAKP